MMFFVSWYHKAHLMLASQKRLNFSNYSNFYALIIPQDNLLRRINSLVSPLSMMNSFLNIAQIMGVLPKILSVCSSTYS